MDTERNKASIGIIVTQAIQNFRAAIEDVDRDRYSFMCTNLMKDLSGSNIMQQLITEDLIVDEPFSVADLAIPPEDLPTAVVAKISNLNELLCSEDRRLRKKVVERVKNEIEYCAYLKMRAILVEADVEYDVFNLAEIVYGSLEFSNCMFWVKVPMLVEVDGNDCSESSEVTVTSGWYTWSKFHGACNMDRKVGAALEMTKALPSETEIKRWLGEPIHCIIIPTSLFTLNEKGFPVLPKEHQQLLKRFFPLCVRMLVEPREPLKAGPKHYRDYVSFLYKKWVNVILTADQDSNDTSTGECDDILFSARQPLIANLTSSTYDRLEKDSVKYGLYEKAIKAAILSKTFGVNNEPLVVMVLGAGRGPLVRAAINAANSANRKIRVYAVEKNQSVLNILNEKQEYIWKALGHNVDVIHTDMRTWNPTEKADLIVSELLDSFGDNGLSPECLEKAQAYLKDDGIIIPKKHTSYLGPLSSPKLYVNTGFTKEAEIARKNQHEGHLETPYNVKMKNKFEIDQPQEVFVFRYPNLSLDDGHDGIAELQFRSPTDCNLHGFAGYFEAELFDGIILSTLPSRHTARLTSWTPIYFPIKNPIPLKEGDLFNVTFKRCTSDYAVWYEWSVVCSAARLSTHNFQGEYFKMIL